MFVSKEKTLRGYKDGVKEFLQKNYLGMNVTIGHVIRNNFL